MTPPSHSVSVITVNQGRPVVIGEGVLVPTEAAGFSKRRLSLLVLLAGLTLLGGCSIFRAPDQVRGNHVDSYRLEELVPGTSTQADVTALLGSPTAKATFDPNTWLYISELTHIRIARTPGIAQQDVVALTFDDRGVLQGIKKLNQKDALPMTVVARTTPSPGTEASFLQQLFGNVGRFNPLGPSSPGTGGGAPTAP